MASRLFSVFVMCATVVLITPPGEPLRAQEGSQAEYEQLVAKAKQEGEVVVYSGRGRERRRARTEPFEQKFGIKVSYVSGRSSELVEKIRAERRAGVFEGDIYFGRPPGTARLMREKVLAPLKPLLFLQEVTDTSRFYQGKHWYTDPGDQYAMIFSAYHSGAFSINTRRVASDSITSLWDLLQPKYKGRIVINDPEPGTGANSSLIYMYVNQQMGPKYIQRLLTEMEPVFQRDCRQIVDLLAKGVYDIALFCSSNTRRGTAQGLPVLNWDKSMKEGAFLQMGGSNQIAVLVKPAHPNAQKLYANWWLSREGQKAFQELDRDYQSIRTDLPLDPVPAKRRRRKGTKYIFPDASKDVAQWAREANELWWKIRRGK